MEADAASREAAPQNIDASKVGPDRLESPDHAKWRTPDLRYAIDNADADAETSWRRTWRLFATQRDQFWWQVVAAIIVAAYVGSLLFVSRPPSGYISFWDGGVGTMAGIVPLVPILIRMRRSTTLRRAWASLAVGVVLYNFANLLHLLHDQNLSSSVSPVSSDLVYLLSYVAFVVGVVLMTQHRYRQSHARVRLDGAVAG